MVKARPIEGFDGYMINTLGKVFSTRVDKKGRELKQRIRNGYPAVTIFKNTKPYSVSVHRLLAKAFIDNPDNLPQVNHKNGVKTDNSIENLEWTTQRDNTIHSYANGLQKGKIGESSHFAKLTVTEASTIKLILELDTNLTQKDIATLFNVSQTTVSDIKNGKKWAKAIVALGEG